MKSRNVLITVAAVAGVGLGSFGLASAIGGEEPAPPVVESNEAEAPGDEADDGIDYQFEGEEVGENGDGIAGPDEATEEAEEAEGAEEAESGDEADDGIDHEFEGEEVGENGDGIAGPNEATEEAEEAEGAEDDD